MRQTRTVRRHVAAGDGIDVELEGRSLHVFPVVLDGQLVDAFLLRVVPDRHGAIVVVVDDGLVYLAAWHLDFGCGKKKETGICIGESPGVGVSHRERNNLATLEFQLLADF